MKGFRHNLINLKFVILLVHLWAELTFFFKFGDWAGQLGDGRAVILGEYTNR